MTEHRDMTHLLMRWLPLAPSVDAWHSQTRPVQPLEIQGKANTSDIPTSKALVLELIEGPSTDPEDTQIVLEDCRLS